MRVAATATGGTLAPCAAVAVAVGVQQRDHDRSAPDHETAVQPGHGGFEGKLIVDLTDGGATYPQTSGTPLDFDGRVFWLWHDSGSTRMAVRDAAGDWAIAQYPDSAGFDLNTMVTYLDAVRPIDGTITAS
jgi:hypothetical protein